MSPPWVRLCQCPHNEIDSRLITLRRFADIGQEQRKRLRADTCCWKMYRDLCGKIFLYNRISGLNRLVYSPDMRGFSWKFICENPLLVSCLEMRWIAWFPHSWALKKFRKCLFSVWNGILLRKNDKCGVKGVLIISGLWLYENAFFANPLFYLDSLFIFENLFWYNRL